MLSMKKILLVFSLLLVFVMGASAQSPVKGFFAPVPDDLFEKSGLRDIENPHVWLIRPAVGLSAVSFTYNAEIKSFETSAFNKVMFGGGYQHFIEVNGEPYNNFSVNALVCFDANPNDITKTGVTVAATVSALNFVNVGIGRDFGAKKFLILTGITYSFN